MSNNSSPSNSKSEDSPLGQVTSLDYKEHWVISHFTRNGVEAKTYYEEPLAKLLQVIEDEVIGEDVKYKNSSRDSDQLANSKKRSRNALKAEQRQILKQIKERYE